MAIEFEIRPSVNNQYYWQFNASNGEEIARSSETYTTKRSCMQSIKLVRDNAGKVSVWDMTGTAAQNVTSELDKL